MAERTARFPGVAVTAMTVEAVGEAAAWSRAMAVKVEGERDGDSNGGGGAGRLGSRAWQ
jgi:hypothetical protein